MHPRSLSLAFAAFAIAATSAPRADATCGGSPDVDVVPYGDGVAPLNAHVWVTLDAGWRTTDISCRAPSTRDCKNGDFDLVLRAAPAKGRPPEDVPTTRRESRSLDVATVELVPSAPLRAHSRYDVWYVEARGATRPRIVGTFATGGSTDVTAPAWRGIGSAASNRVSGPTGKKVITLHVECESDGIDVVVPAATDDQTPTPQMRYALWIDHAKARIDYASPPLLYEAATPIESRGGSPARFVINLGTNEVRRNWEIPKGARAVKIGVKAIDLAGNTSAASEVVVQL